MNRYLVRRATGEVWLWTELLSRRRDLEEVYAESTDRALKKPSMLDPKKVSIAEIEAMPKADLAIFAEIKLGLSVTGQESKSELQDRVKEALFLMPREGEMKVANESGPFGTAKDAMSRSGLAHLTPAKGQDAGDNADKPVRS